jgi:hypothetical protein
MNLEKPAVFNKHPNQASETKLYEYIPHITKYKIPMIYEPMIYEPINHEPINHEPPVSVSTKYTQ